MIQSADILLKTNTNSREWLDAFSSLIRETVREELRRYAPPPHNCQFDVPPEAKQEVGHLIGMVSDIGEGNLATGIEVLRKNHLWLASMRVRGGTVSLTFVLTITSLFATGVVYAIWQGFKHFLKGV